VPQVRLVELGAVDEDLAACDADTVAGQTDDALDQVNVLVRQAEYGDVAAVWSAKRVALVECEIRRLVDPQILPRLERRQHARALDAEVLDDAANADEEQRQQDDGLQCLFAEPSHECLTIRAWVRIAKLRSCFGASV